MPLGIDPYNVLKDFLTGRKDKKELGSLTGKFYRAKTSSAEIEGLLTKVSDTSKTTLLVFETKNGISTVPLDSVEVLEEMTPKVLLDELVAISRAREGARGTHLSWIVGAARPVRDAARNWFDDEAMHLEHQIKLLVELFPRLAKQGATTRLEQIRRDFDSAVQMLDEVLVLVEGKKVSRVRQIYHPNQLSQPLEAHREPDIVAAFVGMFSAANELDDLIKEVDGIVDRVSDQIIVSRIVQEEASKESKVDLRRDS